jgi:hypothetical protein
MWRRAMFSLLSASSLVVCVVFTALWFRSYWTAHRFSWADPARGAAGIAWSHGSVVFCAGPPEASGGLPILQQGIVADTALALPFDPSSQLRDCWAVPTRSNGWDYTTSYRTWWSGAGIAFQTGYKHRGPFLHRPVGGKGATSIYSRRLLVPCWMLSVMAALLPAMWFGTHLKWRVRLKNGRCTSCGYNLTGNISGVCPECGKSAAPTTSCPGAKSEPEPELPARAAAR